MVVVLLVTHREHELLEPGLDEKVRDAGAKEGVPGSERTGNERVSEVVCVCVCV